MELDEIIYNAIKANESIDSLTGGRIFSTCIEVPPTEDDNTPLPYIIITDDPFANNQGTKDNSWEGDTDQVAASVQINADSPSAVKVLRRLVRRAVMEYVASNDIGYLYLNSLNNDGIAWDWMKPCYFDTLHYQCDMEVNLSIE